MSVWKDKERGERERHTHTHREREREREAVVPGAKIDAKKDTQSRFYSTTKNIRKLPAS